MKEVLMYMSYVTSVLLVVGFVINLVVIRMTCESWKNVFIVYNITWSGVKSIFGLVCTVVTVLIVFLLWHAGYIVLSRTLAIMTLVNVAIAFIGQYIDREVDDDA
jgi:hypothetical protein